MAYGHVGHVEHAGMDDMHGKLFGKLNKKDRTFKILNRDSSDYFSTNTLKPLIMISKIIKLYFCDQVSKHQVENDFL